MTAAATLKLIALVLPLGLDTLGVALAGFEAAMPLIGVALGAPLGRAIGSVADYVAAGLILALGAYMLAYRLLLLCSL
jgi:putative Mn2+ efflux pump MntP